MDTLNGRYKMVEDTHIAGYKPLISPYHLKQQIPLMPDLEATIKSQRETITQILADSKRKLLVVGPCSIHDIEVAKDYAQRLKELREKVKDVFEIVMRVYFEKPRTSIGWKGFLYEPHLDGKENINEGLAIGRGLLKYIAELQLPAGTEFLDPFVPQYIAGLVSWGSIGARTVESPQHRQMASGLSMPVGFKNNTQGNLEVAVNAMLVAKHPQSFLGLDQYGTPAVVSTNGNPYVHMILRGSNNGTNYDNENVKRAQSILRKAGLDDKLMVDCSHGNSSKNYSQQPVVFEDVVKQIFDGNSGIVGIMLESNIKEGSQKIPKNLAELHYGVSITDSCIGWETTKDIILDAFKMLAKGMHK